MFFNNALVYQFTKQFELTAEALEEALSEHSFVPCGEQDSQKQGWVSAIPNTAGLAHQANDNILICLNVQTKLLPTDVVRADLESRVAYIEDERGQKVGKKERQTIKEEVIQKLLPQAFPRDSKLYAYIDLKGQRIVVNTSSANKAENLLAYLRQSLGSLPILPFKPESDLLVTLTEWVKNNSCPSPFVFGSNANLKALDEEASTAKLKNIDLTDEEVQIHIANGMYIDRLSLVWDGKIKFDLTDEGHLKTIKFLDVIKEQNEDIPIEDKLAKFDADFALAAGELNQLLGNLATEYQSF